MHKLCLLLRPKTTWSYIKKRRCWRILRRGIQGKIEWTGSCLKMSKITSKGITHLILISVTKCNLLLGICTRYIIYCVVQRLFLIARIDMIKTLSLHFGLGVLNYWNTHVKRNVDFLYFVRFQGIMVVRLLCNVWGCNWYQYNWNISI